MISFSLFTVIQIGLFIIQLVSTYHSIRLFCARKALYEHMDKKVEDARLRDRMGLPWKHLFDSDRDAEAYVQMMRKWWVWPLSKFFEDTTYVKDVDSR